MLRVWLFVWFFISFVSVPAFASGEACDSSDDPRVRNMVQLVHEAVKLVEAKGEATFEKIQNDPERWIDGNGYLFIYRVDGTMMCSPAYPDRVGKNMSGIRDVAGKPVHQFMIDTVRSESNSGWVHYLWPRLGEDDPAWKTSFAHLAVSPTGAEYVVAMGYTDVPLQPCFVTYAVDNAVRLIESEGENAFPYMRSRVSPFVWGSMYVFVFGMDNIVYVNPGSPELEGADVTDLRDAKGFQVVKRMQQVPFGGAGEWVEYYWPKPGEVVDVLKRSYVRKARFKGKEYVVASGFYVQ